MDYSGVFKDFKTMRILIIGDVMVDAYLKGKVSRISPEAPVPIINLESREERLGGAANVAMNIKALGAQPILCSVIGEDSGALQFERLMMQEGLSTEGIVKDNNRITSIKTRVIGNNQQLLRVDEESIQELSTEQEEKLIKQVSSLMKDGVNAVIFEDYNKGTLTKRVIGELIELANQLNIITTVDPKFVNFLEYKNVTLFKPNLKELSEGLGKLIKFTDDRSEFEQAVRELESTLSNQYTFITLSEHGVFIKESQKAHYVPAHMRAIADVSGAGDTVIAVATLALCAGLDARMVAEMANLAGGLVCEHRGVVPIDKEKLLAEVNRTMA